VELVDGEEEARRINRSIHLKYMTPEALSDPNVDKKFKERLRKSHKGIRTAAGPSPSNR
jgi:hypothetical protein